MVWKKRYESHPLFVGVTVFLMTAFVLLFSTRLGGPSLFNPVLGVGFVFGFMFGKRTYVGVILGAFLGQFLMRFYVYSFTLEAALFVAVFLTMILLAQIEIGRKLVKQFHINRQLNQKLMYNFALFIVVALFISIFGAYFVFLSALLLGGDMVDLRYFLTVLFGDFMGLMVLVPSGIYAYRYDSELLFRRSVKDFMLRIGFIVLYVVIVMLLASGWWHLDFLSHAYVLSVFFIVIGFLFAYRVIHYFTLMYLLIGRVVYIEGLPESTRQADMISMVMFAMIMTYLTLMLKRFIDQRMTLTKEIIEKTTLQDTLLTDVYNLLEVSETILEDDDPEESEILARTFKIAHELFKDIDAAYGYLDHHGTIKIVDTLTYVDDAIPYLFECHQFLDEQHDDFYVMDYVSNLMIELYGEKYGLLDEKRYPLKSRVLMRFMISSQTSFVIALDRFEHRKAFSHAQRFRIKQFRNLMNSLYQRNYYTKHHKNLKEEIVLALVRTLELYDEYTKGHSEDVAFFATKMAGVLNPTETFLREIYWAGILHDIGKVGIDNSILNKRDKLSKEEYETVKTHAEFGYDIIADSEHLKNIAEAVKHHHEWWNGKGYPDQLKAQKIPLSSQILAVADMVSTMATDRPYRKKLPKERIVEELEQCAGGQFSPQVASVMLRLIREGILEERFG